MIPDIDENGNLPPGIHKASIDEVIECFCRPRYGKRGPLSERLKALFSFVRSFALGIYVDGSYITSKLAPNDVDIVIIIPDDFDVKSNYGWRLLSFMRQKNKNHLDIFPFKVNEQKEQLNKWLENWCHDQNGNPRGIIYVEVEQ